MQVDESTQDCGRIVAEQIHVQRFKQAVAAPELCVDRLGGDIATFVQPFVDVLQQDGGQLRDRFGRAVVALHQLLGGASTLAVRITQHCGNGALHVKDEAIFAAPGRHVQAGANPAQLVLVMAQHLQFTGGQQPAFMQGRPGFAQARSRRHPAQSLQVAQPTRAFLGVGLKAVRGAGKLLMALTHFCALGQEERHRLRGSSQGLVQLPGQSFVAGQCAALEQCRLHRDIGLLFLRALVDRAHGVADAHAQIPASADEGFKAPREGADRVVRHQQQQIDVGMREQFGPAIAANSKQGSLAVEFAQGPQFGQRLIGSSADAGRQAGRIAFDTELIDQVLHRARVVVAQAGGIVDHLRHGLIHG